MILHERVELAFGGTGSGTFIAAEVSPLSAEEIYATGRNINQATYRIVYGPDAGPSAASAEFVWRGIRLSALGPSLTHTAQGRVHHYEVVAARIGG